MHLAYCKKFTTNTDSPKVEDISFFCADHNQSQLLTYLSRYQNYSRASEPDVYYMLCSVTDLGPSISTSTIQGLGAIELTRQLLEDMKKAVVKKTTPISEIMAAIQSAQIEDKEEDILLGFNLKMVETDPTHNQLVKDLIAKHILCFLDASPTNQPSWALNKGKLGSKVFIQSCLQAPCYLVQHNNTFFLSETVDKYSGDL